MKNRITYLDSLKGLLILLVIIGHSNADLIVPHSIAAIYSFHMPLFFILSGFFLHDKEKNRIHLKKSARAYLLPYFCTCLIGLLLIVVRYVVTHDDQLFTKGAIYLQKIVCVQFERTNDIGPIWFLVALFWGQNLLLFIIHRLSKLQAGVLVLTLATVVILLSDEFFVPFSLFQGITALPFLYVGWLLKSHQDIYNKIFADKICIMAIIITWFIYVWFDNVMRISFVMIPLGFTSIIISLFVSLVLLKYSYLIDCRFFQRIGRHTLLILCVHTLILGMVHKIGDINHNFFYTSLEILSDVVIALTISYIIVKSKHLIINGNIGKRA